MKSAHANPPEKFCRLCLSVSGVILPIFEGEVAEKFPVPLPQKILSCLAIKVCADDPVPPYICHRCLYEVDRFHDFRETCKRTNTTFTKIWSNSGESPQLYVSQILEVKQELHDETVYNDAISDLLPDDEVIDIGSSCMRKRNQCLSVLESMKRVQQAQSANSTTASHSEQLPAGWMEQSKPTTTSELTASSTSTLLECRFCAKPFLLKTSLLEHEELHAKGIVAEEDCVEQIEPMEQHPSEDPSGTNSTPVLASVVAPEPAPAPKPASPGLHATAALDPTTAPVNILPCSVDPTAPTPVPAPVPVPVLATVPVPVPNTTPSPAPTSIPIPVPSPVAAAASANKALVVPEPTTSTPTPSATPTPPQAVQQAMEIHSRAGERESQNHRQTSRTQESAGHTAVEAVSLTDVTAMLLEGAFDGVRSVAHQALATTCRYCHDHFSDPDVLRRHERLYCSRKPSLTKLKQPVQQQVQPIQQHPPNSHHSSVESALALASTTQQQLSHSAHHLVIQQQQPSQVHPGHPVHQSPSLQIPFSQKAEVETTSAEPTRSCKHCHKDFIHRGSLWRHQMFCDSNPERDLNRIVAGSKKKSASMKNCELRQDAQQHMIHGGVSLPITIQNVGGTQFRRSGLQSTLGPFKCKFCEKRFLHRGSWWRHQKMFCTVNPEVPTVKVEAKVQNNQGVPNFACRYCERTFLHRGSCWHHEQTHTGIKEHACRYCSKTFNEKSRLARHERMHLGIKPFSCRQCGKAFCDASNLRNHEQIHGERASFLCAWCGKSYTRRALLLKHEQVHAGEGPVFTCPSCPRTFPDPNSLNEHGLSHSQDRKKLYLCQSCGQTFTSQNLLSQHNRLSHHHTQSSRPQQIHQTTSQIHHSQEQVLHTCNICNKVFTDISSLRHHELLHSAASRPYRCPSTVCGAVFHHRSQLDSHLLMHGSDKAHLPTSVAMSSAFHHHSHQQQLLAAHEIQQTLQQHHHELLHREGTYVIGNQDGQAIAVHHLVSQIP